MPRRVFSYELKTSMEDLKKALELRAKYNLMDFDKFLLEFEDYTDCKLDEEFVRRWKLMGLNNTDLLLAHLGKIGITVIELPLRKIYGLHALRQLFSLIKHIKNLNLTFIMIILCFMSEFN